MAIENRGPQLEGVAITMLVLAVVSMSLRGYVRIHITKAFGIDDWFMLAATLSFIMQITTCIGGIHYGTGRHMVDIEPEDASKALMYWYLCYLSYATTMIAAKFSVGFFLLRVTPNRVHQWIIYINMAVTLICGLTFFFVALFQCHPVSYFWDRTQVGSCIPMAAILAITCIYSAFALITDCTFAILPMFIIRRLQMNKRTKSALIVILGMACIASIGVAVRLFYIPRFLDGDFLWNTLDIAIWSETEMGLAITAGSLATLRPLFRLAMEKFGYLTHANSGANTASRKSNGHSNVLARNYARPSSHVWKHSEIQIRHDIEVDHELRENISRNASKDESMYRTAYLGVNKADNTQWVSGGGNDSEEELQPQGSSKVTCTEVV